MVQKKIIWTTQQSRAIEEHGRAVFVSASAGTGKTAVLSGSCVDVVMDASACPDVWSILVVTFTDMAAEEMRSRIARQLNSAIEASTDGAVRQRLRRQLILLGAADVSTIHSFCKRLITEHFHEISLDPTFRIIDADEAKLLKAETLEKTIDWAWQQHNLADAMRLLLSRRDLRTIDGFPARIIEISDFLDCLVSRTDWLARAQILAESTNPFNTDLAQSQKQIIAERLGDSLSRIQNAQMIYRSAAGGKENAKFEELYVRPITQLLQVLQKGDWARFNEALHSYHKPRVETPKDIDKELAGIVHQMVKKAVDSVEDLSNLAVLNPDYLNRLTAAVSKQTLVLIKLIERFDYLYRKAKDAINCLDFADLEHYALQLLGKRGQESFSIQPSETALKLREKYKYVFVDEYQDINGVQQAILNMISKPDNVFAVGDPKQSIYQWRGARPEIFLQHLKRASTEPKSTDLGLRVDLNVNFRSVKPILDFVNLIFSRIMTASFANMDYDESAHLKPQQQSEAPNLTGPSVELHILDKAQKDDDRREEQADNQSSPAFTDRQQQAALIADRIKQLVGADKNEQHLQILDKQTGRPRPVEYRDIVILMRSLAGKNDFVEVLRLCGVPVSCETTAGYFEATEITDMLSLLKVLDNPRRDIELAAVLRSPSFGFTDTELAKIRLSGKKIEFKPAFCDCVLSFCDSKDDRGLADKLVKTLATLDEWRTVARRGRIAELVWHIYRRTGCLSFVSALPDGPARRANLLKLHDRAVQFEGFAGNAGVPSLTRFIEFIEKLLAAGQDWSPAEPESAAGNAVRVLSVHKSKGLEFPVVFVADLDSQFSKKDSKQDCLVDEQSTIGLRIIDPDAGSRLDSLAYQVIEENSRRKSLAEEMRILYVAMTRAMNRLILVGCRDKKSCRRIITTSCLFEDQPIPRAILGSCRSHLDWILSALSNQPLLLDAFQTNLKSAPADDNLFSVQIYDRTELEKLSVLIHRSKQVKIINQKFYPPRRASINNLKDLAQIKAALNWRYSFGDAPLLPAKRSVTQWTHRNDEFTVLDFSLSLDRKPKTVLSAEQLDTLDGRLIGAATHLIISQLDLSKPITIDAIKRLTDKLVADGAFTEPIAKKINAESIVGFFQSDLGQMTLDTCSPGRKNNSVWREWPFTFAVPASQWRQSGHCEAFTLSGVEGKGRSNLTSDEPRATSHDSIIVQGIIDLLIESPEGLLIIDFKTDQVNRQQLDRRAKLYRGQLDLYAQAAHAIIGKNVLGKYLYFLKPACKIGL